MTNLLLLGFLPSGSEWIIIALVILLLFGGKKIPELMRGLGKGVKSFKDGVNEAKEEINKAQEDLDKPAEKKRAGYHLYYLTIYYLLFDTLRSSGVWVGLLPFPQRSPNSKLSNSKSPQRSPNSK